MSKQKSQQKNKAPKEKKKPKVPAFLMAIWQRKFLIIILAMLIALLPMAVSRQSMALTRTILTAIGIDKDGSDIVVYGEHVLFNFDPFGIPERHIAVGRGETLDAALREISVNMGRTISFSHCTLIIIGSELYDTDLVELMQPLYDNNQLNNAAALVYTESDVETLIETSIESGDVRSAKLQQIVEFNRTHEDKYFTSLERFFKANAREHRTAKMPVINVEGGDLQNTGDAVTFVGGILVP